MGCGHPRTRKTILMVLSMSSKLRDAFGLTGKVEGAWISRRRRKGGLRGSRVELTKLLVLENAVDSELNPPRR
jgi:hypothetical protein